MKFTKKTIYIGLFSVLYLIVAFSSFFHACAFFGLANNSWMSIILAFAFEVGQAAVLFSLLTSTKDRARVMPWILMTMFTLVQVIGNIYSSYKYIIINSVENLRYFKEPIFIWTELPDAQANVIIVYLVGAMLPLASLFLTAMITNYLTDQQEEQKLLESQNIPFNEGDSLINQNSVLQMENQGLQESNNKKDEELARIKQELEELKQLKENINDVKKDDRQETDTEDTSDNNDDEQQLGGTEDKGGTESKLSENNSETDEQQSESIEEDLKKRASHFINL